VRREDLASYSVTTPIVVFTHRPLFDLKPEWEWFTRDGDEVMKVLSRHENVTVPIRAADDRAAPEPVLTTEGSRSDRSEPRGRIPPRRPDLPSAPTPESRSGV